MLHTNSDEVNTTITNGMHDVLHKNSDEGSKNIANERHDVLQNKSDEGSISIMQYFEEVKEIEMSNNSAPNDVSTDIFFRK